MNDDIIKPSWLNMSENRLFNLLIEQAMPSPLIKDIVSRVRAIKAERKAQRTKHTVAHKLWADVLTPARTELATVRTMKAQVKRQLTENFNADEYRLKFDALAAYDTAIAAVIEKLRAVQQAGEYTPQQFAAALREAGKMPSDGAGTHWTDYVRQKDRLNVEHLFTQCAPPKRGKAKTPFERRISAQAHTRMRMALIKRLTTEQENAEQEYAITTDPDEKARLDALIKRMQEAQYRIDVLPNTAPVPATWEGLLE